MAYGFFIVLTPLVLRTSMRIAHMVIGVEFVLFHFSVLRAITQMVIAGGAFFRPLSQSPRWRLVVRGLFFVFVVLFFFHFVFFSIVAPKAITQW